MEKRKSRVTILSVLPQCQVVLSMLADCYAALRPKGSSNDFQLEILDWVAIHDNPTIVAPDEIVEQFLRPELNASVLACLSQQFVRPILISVAYCARAQRNYQRSFFEVAWSDTANAMYWCGVARTVSGIEPLLLKTMTEARAEGAAQAIRETGKTGAVARSDAYEPIREFARTHARINARKFGGKWPSRNQAVTEIVAKLPKFYEEQVALTGRKMPSPPTNEAIHKWLKEMEDAASLFPSKKRVHLP